MWSTASTHAPAPPPPHPHRSLCPPHTARIRTWTAHPGPLSHSPPAPQGTPRSCHRCPRHCRWCHVKGPAHFGLALAAPATPAAAVHWAVCSSQRGPRLRWAGPGHPVSPWSALGPPPVHCCRQAHRHPPTPALPHTAGAPRSRYGPSRWRTPGQGCQMGVQGLGVGFLGEGRARRGHSPRRCPGRGEAPATPRAKGLQVP